MRIHCTSAFLLIAVLAAQTPAPAGTGGGDKGDKPAPVVQGPTGKQETKQDGQAGTGQKPPAPNGSKAETGKDPAKGDAKSGDGKGNDGKAGDAKIDKAPADQPAPRGNDPADLRAIRGAQQMVDAEKKLAEQIKSGKIQGLDKIVTFDELSNWPYEDGLKGMPKRVKDLQGKKVLMTGFMLPIDEVQNIKEFLLVQSLWSCCYGQPPDINGLVRVVMPKGKTSDYFFDPLKIVGTFKVEATVLEGYCVDIYQLQVESLEAIK